jgi:hypothetical protein
MGCPSDTSTKSDRNSTTEKSGSLHAVEGFELSGYLIPQPHPRHKLKVIQRRVLSPGVAGLGLPREVGIGRGGLWLQDTLCLSSIRPLYPHNLGVLLQLSKYLISQWVGDLSIHAGIPDVPMSQVIGNILDTSPSFK